jgi:hypothetical protein
MQVIEEDITKFHIRSHFLPFKEKYHGSEKHAKVVLVSARTVSVYIELDIMNLVL